MKLYTIWIWFFFWIMLWVPLWWFIMYKPTPPTTCSEMAIVCSEAGLGIENAMNVLLSNDNE